MPQLSIIIPCYNNGEFLSLMIDCCIQQTFKDWELIIVDDHSTDDITHKIVKEYSYKDKRIHFYMRDREPKGSVVCRNIGFCKSTGKYIIHFDADDLCSPTCFEKRVEFMNEHPDCDYASFPAKDFYNGHELPQWDGIISKGTPIEERNVLPNFLKAQYPFAVWCNIYRRSSIEKFLWDEKVKIYTDFSYIIPFILSGAKHLFCEMKEYDYFYRKFKQEGNNMCSNFISKEKCDSTVYLFEKTLNSISKRQDYEYLKQCFMRFILIHLERLIKGHCFEEANQYAEMLSTYYPKEFSTIKDIIVKCASQKKDKIMLIYLHWLLYKYFGVKTYKTYFYHDIVKLFIPHNNA